MGFIEKLFEGLLWRSRYVVIFAVVASMASAFAIFYMATTDVVYLVRHIVHYADANLTDLARKALHDATVTHVVEVVDGYLLGTVMLIFALGLYELFVSEIDAAKGSKTSSKILVIGSLDDLKQRLAKVIIMILIVTIFELTMKVTVSSPIDLLYLAGALALIGLALYLTHAADGSHGKAQE
ncbi:MAG: hypothetical protein COS39_01190 [Hydrogenophilales bacterium CG03_land_8_20_14_0_80_62_28]|nr:YqhA family protein [Betaproteobacteria bacterium]OIO79089.1 MAG: hypothetical protein AUJ86_03130 [Hydrogenophilaceae bacterium CG1_02_62_390]PIV24405.1 MAG: hypothetical protein COS39_01190 [Hydrogenophilales bacterium CG03_land_8_20_14_0_80_62_28]PIW39653.1 MAG: hypothetical protein COW23_00025 [Hydrogenophilales bacterium CG15_BIG_FIL_POST_REV_8_21_14_020_62_31]PIW71982.1 MAG: hypothetical protein COW07_04655 [Hydrogenophilales bacterium CG12_big_fil_rev_8_21_14_0_65_61_21]PIX02430.1 MA